MNPMPGVGEKKHACEHCGLRVIWDVQRLWWQHAFPVRTCSDRNVKSPITYIGTGMISDPAVEREAMWALERDELLREMERMRSCFVFELADLFDRAVNNAIFLSQDRVESILQLLKEYA